MAWMTPAEIATLGFAAVGRDVRLSDKAVYYNCAAIRIGDRSRIDDFCVLSAGAGGITIGENVHVAVFSSLVGAAAITMEDFSGLSSRVSVYSSSDDYRGSALTNPTVPPEFTAVTSKPVHLGRHAIVGAGAVLLPGATLGEGVAVGALSVVRGPCEPFGIYAGVPAKRVAERQRDLLEREAAYRQFLARG